MPSPEDRIKEIGKQAGAQLVGIASVEEINRYAPEGHRPSDVLIGAKSVVVFAGRTAFAGAFHSPSSRVRGFNRDFPAIRNAVAMKIARLIEEEYGHYSITQPASMFIGFMPLFSIKLFAELAGLGTRGMAAGTILNPDYGLLNFSCVITTMPLKADGRMAEPACPHPSCVKIWEKKHTTPCLTACPDCLEGELEGGKIKWMRYNRIMCSTRAQTTSFRALQKVLLAVIDEEDPEKRKMLAFGSFFTRCLQSATYSTETSGQCSICIGRCPLCRPMRKLEGGEE